MTIRRLPNQELPRNFKDWTGPLVRHTFNLAHSPQLPAMFDWNQARHNWPEQYSSLIESMRLELFEYHQGWNEIDLMMQFIGPLFKLISFQGEHYGIFYHRSLKAKINKILVNGILDSVVATGYSDPLQPFFFLKEYKKSQGYDNEPFGQLLISMVAAQQLNNDGQPLYGCYVIGSLWRFVLLDGQKYATTQSYDATDAGELQIIWSMLVEVKRIVEERVERLLAQAD